MTLVHAARWWLGQKLVQLIKARGGTVIGLVSTQAKAAIAQRIGAADVVVSTGGRFRGAGADLTGGEGVHTVFDGGGATTFRASMGVLRRHGTLLNYGAVLGAAPAPDDNCRT
ncbi:zinc-binding dehydrogenase [Nocardia wallacei]|uniref:zinc-binding dehydrogenase n=1 Tax=Nocardia wallacei TaxID=480035 RepID=UPI002453A8FA|nr:zinc-binding dehydrogenase [Nocardia wallacei]